MVYPLGIGTESAAQIFMQTEDFRVTQSPYYFQGDHYKSWRQKSQNALQYQRSLINAIDEEPVPPTGSSDKRVSEAALELQVVVVVRYLAYF